MADPGRLTKRCSSNRVAVGTRLPGAHVAVRASCAARSRRAELQHRSAIAANCYFKVNARAARNPEQTEGCVSQNKREESSPKPPSGANQNTISKVNFGNCTYTWVLHLVSEKALFELLSGAQPRFRRESLITECGSGPKIFRTCEIA